MKNLNEYTITYNNKELLNTVLYCILMKYVYVCRVRWITSLDLLLLFHYELIDCCHEWSFKGILIRIESVYRRGSYENDEGSNEKQF